MHRKEEGEANGEDHLHSPIGFPGQPPGGEVATIAPDPDRFRKAIPSQSTWNGESVAVLQQFNDQEMTMTIYAIF